MLARGTFAAPSKETTHYPGHALCQTCTARWKYLDAHVKIAFGPYKSQLRKAGATLIRFLESCNTSAVRSGLQAWRDVFPRVIIEGGANTSSSPTIIEVLDHSSLLRRS